MATLSSGHAFIVLQGDGTDTYSFPFTYLKPEYIFVKVNGVVVPHTLISTNTVQLTTSPTSSDRVEIYRETSRSERLVDFQAQSTLTEETLDKDSDQVFNIGQEAIDEVSKAISINTALGIVDLGGARIINLGTPVDGTDAATKDSIDASVTAAASSASSASSSASTASGHATTATTKASEAFTSATNAATSAISSETSRVASEAAKTASETARDAAQVAQGAAETAETNAGSSASSASTQATNAANSASTATTKASEASASASAASTSETNAGNSASNASTSATNAATSETNAETHKDDSETAKVAAEAALAAIVGVDASTGVSDAAKYTKLDSTGKIDQSLIKRQTETVVTKTTGDLTNMGSTIDTWLAFTVFGTTLDKGQYLVDLSGIIHEVVPASGHSIMPHYRIENSSGTAISEEKTGTLTNTTTPYPAIPNMFLINIDADGTVVRPAVRLQSWSGGASVSAHRTRAGGAYISKVIYRKISD